MRRRAEPLDVSAPRSKRIPLTTKNAGMKIP